MLVGECDSCITADSRVAAASPTRQAAFMPWLRTQQPGLEPVIYRPLPHEHLEHCVVEVGARNGVALGGAVHGQCGAPARQKVKFDDIACLGRADRFYSPKAIAATQAQLEDDFIRRGRFICCTFGLCRAGYCFASHDRWWRRSLPSEKVWQPGHAGDIL